MLHFLLTITLTTAPALAKAKFVYLKNAKAIYEAAGQAFPAQLEQVGNGFTQEMSLRSLHCLSNQDEDYCEAETFGGPTVTLHSDDNVGAQKRLSALTGALRRGGAKFSTEQSPAGPITSITLKGFDCARIEPKPSSPRDLIRPRYSCAYEI